MKLDTIYNKWLAIQPLTEAEQNMLSMRFTVEYNYNSNHLEGNTLTYGQTELLLLFGKVSGEGHLKDFNDMKASEVSVRRIIQNIAHCQMVYKLVKRMVEHGYITRNESGYWRVIATSIV